MVSDHFPKCELQLNEEVVSQMLGTRRSTVTLVAGRLQRRGLIEYSRGHISIPKLRFLRVPLASAIASPMMRCTGFSNRLRPRLCPT